MFPTRLAAASLSLAVATSACLTGPGDNGPPPLLDKLPRALTAGEQQAVQVSNGFTFGLLSQISQLSPDKNIFVSPFSVTTVGGMIMDGARGATRDAMATTLGFGTMSQLSINESYRGLHSLILGLDPRTEMLVANSVWSHQPFPILPTFLSDARQYFSAEVQSLDFTNPATLTTINNWVSTKTKGKIPTILEVIDPGEILFAINAMYFKGQWREQFKKELTRSGTFAGRNGSQTASFMARETKQPYFQTNELQATDLWYGNGAYSMTVMLPAPQVNLEQVIQSMDRGTWNTIVAGLHESELDFAMPKFTLEYKRSLKPDLAAMGMGIAFSDFADLSGISTAASLTITRVDHKTFVDVNEEGTEAAAVTVGGVGTTSSGPPSMRVDRPFLFAIRERLSGTVLFVGKIVDMPPSR